MPLNRRLNALNTLRLWGASRAMLYEPIVPTPEYLAYLEELERCYPPFSPLPVAKKEDRS